MKTTLAIMIAVVLTWTAAAMPSYEWVDVQREHTGAGVDYGTIRLVYTSSSPDGSEHTYRLTAGGGLWGFGNCTEAEVYASDFQGAYIFDFGFVQSGNTYTTDFIQHATPNPTPSDWKETLEAPASRLRAVAWGPVRVDNQNGDGVHEDREWVDVRISWNGGAAPGGTIDPGTVTYRLVPQGNKKYQFTDPALALQINGQDYAQLRATVQFMGDDSIEAEVINFTGRLAMDWGKGAGSGDYTGALDSEGGPNEASVYEFVIVGQGPTVGGPGDDPIEGGGDDGGGDDGGGDGGGDPPGDQDGDGELDPTSVPDTGLECFDLFVDDFSEMPIFQALYGLTVGISDVGPGINLEIPRPGNGVAYSVPLTTTPDASPMGVKLDELRSGIRVCLTLCFGWITIRAILRSLERW